MRVRAIATGFDNLTVREPGDEFNMPDGSIGTWFESVDKKQKNKPQSQDEVKSDLPLV